MLGIELHHQSDPLLCVTELARECFQDWLVVDRRPEELFMECSRLSSDYRNH